jgi:hypothetical protein
MRAGSGLLRSLRVGFGLTLACALFAVASTASASAAGCFADPSGCGYPDQTNTGVPAGTTLTPSGSRTITTNGTVLSGIEFTGPVTIAADNVTIKNSRIAISKGGSGTYGLIVNQGADNFTLEHSEVVGPAGESNGLESAVWNHYRNPGVVASHDYFHHCADCWEGSGTLSDDYMVVDAAYPGSHNEDVYVCGGAIKVEHSTLYDQFEQTATVFGDTAGCGGNVFEVDNSLLAGGGWMLYPQGSANSAVGSTKITGNRFARCLNGAVYNSRSGGTACKGGVGDSNGYYPYGGYFGVVAYYFGGTWSGNVWDDNGRPFCADGSEGCGSVTAPPSGPTEEPGAGEPEGGGPTEEPPTGTGPPTSIPLEAILGLPPEVQAEVPVTLDGTASTGPGTLSCTWSIQTASGSASLNGCLTNYTFAATGSSTVKLTVRSGRLSDSAHTNVTVLPAPAAPAPGETPPASGYPSPSGDTVPAAVGPSAAALAAGPLASGGAGPAGSTATDARRAWKAPAAVRPGAKVRLLAGAPGATCTWRITGSTPSARPIIRHGCATALRAPADGALMVRLSLRGADGSLSAARRTIRIDARAGVPHHR